jgi:glycosyltransferase involved in cell wall biosynthesis
VRWVPRFITDDEIAAYFRRADLVVLPYREIDQSGVLFTALAFGVPLLLSAVGGFPELAAHGAAALVPPGDPPALAAELRRLLADDAARERLAAAARAAAAGPYSWDAIAGEHLALYGSLAGG